MLALAYDNETGEGGLIYEGGKLVSEGYDLETAMLVSLLCDAPALPGDALPNGTPKRGWWADGLDGEARPLGSRLWLLEDALATEQTARRAKDYAEAALKWLVDDGHVRAVGATPELVGDAVWLQATAYLKSGSEIRLDAFKVN